MAVQKSKVSKSKVKKRKNSFLIKSAVKKPLVKLEAYEDFKFFKKRTKINNSN